MRSGPVRRPGSGKRRRLSPGGFEVERLTSEPEELRVWATPRATSARCPECRSRSGRVHSRYSRAVSDLPWRGIVVTLRVHVRRFFRDEVSCGRRIFCERLPEIAARAP